MPPRPPVIVIGSGRSGTAYVSRILEGLGVFMGAPQDPNHEAFFFIRLNTWLLAEADATWDNPEPLKPMLEHGELRARARAHLGARLGSPRAGGYLGWGAMLRYRSPARFDRPWGWKDPRNTFTLPVWLDLFPDAKVVHVLRHGIDVAASDWQTQEPSRGLAFLAAAAARRRFHLPTIAREARVWWRTRERSSGLARFGSIDDALSLWDRYVEEARRHLDGRGDRGIEIRFEDLVSDPDPCIRRLAQACDLEAPDEVVARLAGSADPRRALAYRRDPGLLDLARRSRELLGRHGYSPDGAGLDAVADAGREAPPTGAAP